VHGPVHAASATLAARRTLIPPRHRHLPLKFRSLDD
jgi:hypothetical protein